MNNPFTLTYLSLPLFTLLFPLNCVTPHPATHTCYSLLSPIPFVILPYLPLVLFSSIRSHTGRSTKSRHMKFPHSCSLFVPCSVLQKQLIRVTITETESKRCKYRRRIYLPFQRQSFVFKPDSVNARRKCTTEVRFNLRS